MEEGIDFWGDIEEGVEKKREGHRGMKIFEVDHIPKPLYVYID